jgi:hypothetical protein
MGYETAFSQQRAKLRDAPMGIAEVATECETAGRRGAYPVLSSARLVRRQWRERQAIPGRSGSLQLDKPFVPLIDAVGLTHLKLAADQRSYFIEAARR